MSQTKKADLVRQQMHRAKTDPEFATMRWIQEQQGGYATYLEKQLAEQEATSHKIAEKK